MSSFIIKVKNTAGSEGTVIADAGFSYTDKLNETNEGQLKITATSVSKRGLFEIGSEVYIYRNGTLDFHGMINALSYLDAGGIAADLVGYEVWLGKENGDYASSPWTSTASATIASSIIAESTKFTAGTIEAGETLDFSVEITDSLWNALASLTKRTAQDIGIDYANSQIDILDHKGSSTSVETMNDGIQIQDMTVRQSYPIANDVRVYGQSEGQTRIKSTVAHGQDATSKATYGTIRRIYDDSSVITEAEANLLADKLVAKWKDPVKVYEFDVINPNKSLVAGDVITINSSTKGLTNEEVRIVSIERGIRNETEFLTMEVTNKAYSQVSKGIESYVAELEKKANDLKNYDQYQQEYSNQNCSTCIGGSSYVCSDGTWSFGGKLYDNGPVTCLLNVFAVCYGDQYFHFNPGMTVCAPMLQSGSHAGVSSTWNIFSNGINMCNSCIINACMVCSSCFVGPGIGGGCWQDATDPYITPCGGCGLWMCGDIADGTSTHKLGIAMSPGAFAEVNAACGLFTTCVTGPYVYSSGDVCAADDLLAGDDIVAGGDISAVNGLLTVNQINVGGSSACTFYVSGTGYVSGSMCSGSCFASSVGCFSCTYACRRLRLPVGTNCY